MKEQDLQIKAGSAAELIFHPHLQEPILATPLQPPRLVNEVHITQLDMLIQRTARLEPLPAVPLREQPRLHAKWARKPAFVHPQTFSRPLFVMSFTCTLNEWGTTRPLRQVTDMWAAMQAVRITSQVRGGFGSPSGPGYRPTVSALPEIQPWVDPSYQ